MHPSFAPWLTVLLLAVHRGRAAGKKNDAEACLSGQRTRLAATRERMQVVARMAVRPMPRVVCDRRHLGHAKQTNGRRAGRRVMVPSFRLEALAPRRWRAHALS